MAVTCSSTFTATASTSAGYIRASVCDTTALGASFTISDITYYVKTADAGASVSIGIYQDSGSGTPGALIDSTSASTPSTTGAITITGLNIPVTNTYNQIWIGFQTTNTGSFVMEGGPSASGSMYYVTTTWNNYPDPFGSGVANVEKSHICITTGGGPTPGGSGTRLPPPPIVVHF